MGSYVIIEHWFFASLWRYARKQMSSSPIPSYASGGHRYIQGHLILRLMLAEAFIRIRIFFSSNFKRSH
ncbi:hypothetical protein TNCT_240011 [Trichonephila clavata]|uniref:Uncharacterized protein n=1 Tax=Trichonephila clavata TaxID=2740835 RepID=A0A8X6GA86_TRICU|nr:hypothetical protein TNCT_240011 [Trichonephila clavata]